MFHVQFFENKSLLLSQLLENVPAQGENIKLKGRKGTVTSVSREDNNKILVHVVLEKVNKNKLFVDPKKKRR